jgi:hypothetical protein
MRTGSPVILDDPTLHVITGRCASPTMVPGAGAFGVDCAAAHAKMPRPRKAASSGVMGLVPLSLVVPSLVNSILCSGLMRAIISVIGLRSGDG